MLQRLRFHTRYLSYALGHRRLVGMQRYRMSGYFSDKFCPNDLHEPHLEILISELLRQRPGAFIDVGVNVGQTLCKVLACDPARLYVGFEPQIACCFYVDQFIRKNALLNAKVIPIALGEVSGLLELHANGDTDEMATLEITSPGERVVAAQRKVQVAVMRGDEAIHQLRLGAIAVIKIDVEGAELTVLRGLDETLRRLRPAVLFEVLPNFTGRERAMIDASLARERSRRAEHIMGLFGALGYVVHQIDPKGATAPISAFKLNDTDSYVGRDYLAAPAEALTITPVP
jgi:FkbM family methyltransferase